MAKKNEIDILLRVRDEATKTIAAFSGTLGDLVGQFGKIGLAGAGVFGAFEAVRGAIESAKQFIAESVNAALEAQDAYNRLGSAVELSGKSYEDVRAPLGEFLGELQRTTRFTDEEAAEGLQRLITFTGSYDSALKALPTTLDLATRLHIGLDAATKLVGVAIEGNAGQLARYGIRLDDATKKAIEFADQETRTGIVLDALSKKVGGSAVQDAKTLSGELAILKNQYGELQEAVGRAFLALGDRGVLTDTAAALGNIAKAIDDIRDAIPAEGFEIAANVIGLEQLRETVRLIGLAGKDVSALKQIADNSGEAGETVKALGQEVLSFAADVARAQIGQVVPLPDPGTLDVWQSLLDPLSVGLEQISARLEADKRATEAWTESVLNVRGPLQDWAEGIAKVQARLEAGFLGNDPTGALLDRLAEAGKAANAAVSGIKATGFKLPTEEIEKLQTQLDAVREKGRLAGLSQQQVAEATRGLVEQIRKLEGTAPGQFFERLSRDAGEAAKRTKDLVASELSQIGLTLQIVPNIVNALAGLPEAVRKPLLEAFKNETFVESLRQLDLTAQIVEGFAPGEAIVRILKEYREAGTTARAEFEQALSEGRSFTFASPEKLNVDQLVTGGIDSPFDPFVRGAEDATVAADEFAEAEKRLGITTDDQRAAFESFGAAVRTAFEQEGDPTTALVAAINDLAASGVSLVGVFDQLPESERAALESAVALHDGLTSLFAIPPPDGLVAALDTINASITANTPSIDTLIERIGTLNAIIAEGEGPLQQWAEDQKIVQESLLATAESAQIARDVVAGVASDISAAFSQLVDGLVEGQVNAGEILKALAKSIVTSVIKILIDAAIKKALIQTVELAIQAKAAAAAAGIAFTEAYAKQFAFYSSTGPAAAALAAAAVTTGIAGSAAAGAAGAAAVAGTAGGLAAGGAGVPGAATGGIVAGTDSGDTHPFLLEAGEAIVPQAIAALIFGGRAALIAPQALAGPPPDVEEAAVRSAESFRSAVAPVILIESATAQTVRSESEGAQPELAAASVVEDQGLAESIRAAAGAIVLAAVTMQEAGERIQDFALAAIDAIRPGQRRAASEPAAFAFAPTPRQIDLSGAVPPVGGPPGVIFPPFPSLPPAPPPSLSRGEAPAVHVSPELEAIVTASAEAFADGAPAAPESPEATTFLRDFVDALSAGLDGLIVPPSRPEASRPTTAALDAIATASAEASVVGRAGAAGTPGIPGEGPAEPAPATTTVPAATSEKGPESGKADARIQPLLETVERSVSSVEQFASSTAETVERIARESRESVATIRDAIRVVTGVPPAPAAGAVPASPGTQIAPAAASIETVLSETVETVAEAVSSSISASYNQESADFTRSEASSREVAQLQAQSLTELANSAEQPRETTVRLSQAEVVQNQIQSLERTADRAERALKPPPLSAREIELRERPAGVSTPVSPAPVVPPGRAPSQETGALPAVIAPLPAAVREFSRLIETVREQIAGPAAETIPSPPDRASVGASEPDSPPAPPTLPPTAGRAAPPIAPGQEPGRNRAGTRQEPGSATASILDRITETFREVSAVFSASIEDRKPAPGIESGRATVPGLPEPGPRPTAPASGGAAQLPVERLLLEVSETIERTLDAVETVSESPSIPAPSTASAALQRRQEPAAAIERKLRESFGASRETISAFQETNASILETFDSFRDTKAFESETTRSSDIRGVFREFATTVRETIEAVRGVETGRDLERFEALRESISTSLAPVRVSESSTTIVETLRDVERSTAERSSADRSSNSSAGREIVRAIAAPAGSFTERREVAERTITEVTSAVERIATSTTLRDSVLAQPASPSAGGPKVAAGLPGGLGLGLPGGSVVSSSDESARAFASEFSSSIEETVRALVPAPGSISADRITRILQETDETLRESVTVRERTEEVLRERLSRIELPFRPAAADAEGFARTEFIAARDREERARERTAERGAPIVVQVPASAPSIAYFNTTIQKTERATIDPEQLLEEMNRLVERRGYKSVASRTRDESR